MTLSLQHFPEYYFSRYVLRALKITFVDFISFRGNELLKDVGNYGYSSAMKKLTQLRADKHITCFCLQIRQTSSGNVNWISLLRIVKSINPCVVLKYDNVVRHW